MKLAIWAIGAVLIFSGVVFWVMTHPNRDKSVAMERELAELESQNDALAAKNTALTRDVEALRNDPRVVARRAREVGPFAAPNEVVVQFKQTKKSDRVEVVVNVHEDAVEVAGAKHRDDDFKSALASFQKNVKGAHFVLEKTDGIDPVRLDELKTILDRTNAKTFERTNAKTFEKTDEKTNE